MTNSFRADLHCHTTSSDGSSSPEELVRLAKEIGLSGLSITDHDTVDAYVKAIPLAKELGIQLIPGIEFSATLNLASVHILGYGFDLDHPSLKEFCAMHIKRRQLRNEKILELLTKAQMPISELDLLKTIPEGEKIFDRVIGRPHIAKAMVNKGYVTSIQEAFRKFISEGKPCYVPGISINAQETIDLIHEIGGVAVIAHPHLIKGFHFIDALLKMNFDGIECYYGRFLPRDHQRWLDIAKKKGWLITGGSDFHGTVKPDQMLGCSWIDEEHFNRLIKK